MKREAAMAGMQPQGQEASRPPNLEEAKEDSPLKRQARAASLTL